jgi:hypothetical protein
VVLADSYAASVATAVKPATMRKWLQRGKLARHGYDAEGRVLVDLQEVETLKSSLTVR